MRQILKKFVQKNARNKITFLRPNFEIGDQKSKFHNRVFCAYWVDKKVIVGSKLVGPKSDSSVQGH